MRESIMNIVRGLQFRGKPRVMRRLVPRHGNVKAPIFNAKLDLDLSNFIDWMIYSGCYEPINTARFRAVLDPGMCVVDVGANIGYFTLLSADLVGRSGRVFAFEPQPDNFKILAEAVAGSDLPQVELFRIGLSDAPGAGHVFQADQTTFPNRTASMVGGREDQPKFSVEIDTLDRFLEAREIRQVDLIKIDVDGFEWKILQGGSRSFDTRIRNVLIELSPVWLARTGTTQEEVVRWLEGKGFRRVPVTWMQNNLLGRTGDALFTQTRPTRS